MVELFLEFLKQFWKKFAIFIRSSFFSILIIFNRHYSPIRPQFNNLLTIADKTLLAPLKNLTILEWSKNPWECDCLSYNFIELNETIPATAHTVLCQTPEQFKDIYLDDINIDCVVPETTETFVTTSHPSTTEIIVSTSQQSFTETVGPTSHSKIAETELFLVFFSGVYVVIKLF